MIPPPAPVDVATVFARYRAGLEASVRASIPTSTEAGELFDLLGYHLGWLDLDLRPARARTGKMLRPTLCLLSCEAVGGDYQRALPAATALELLHNFSLIHDDVEDRGDERHGRPTLWSRWGEAVAVNAGDALLIVSELTLIGATARGLSPEETLRLIRLLNECCLRLTEGQHLDITQETNLALTEEQYFRMIARKTATLLGCSAQLGALSGGAAPARAAAFEQYGINLGLGFQIQDDILGIWGDPAVTGKPAAADVFGRKITLPIIEALRVAPPTDAARIASVYRSSRPTVHDVDEVVQLVSALGVRERTETLAGTYVDRALAELQCAEPEPGPGRELATVAMSLVGRKF